MAPSACLYCFRLISSCLGIASRIAGAGVARRVALVAVLLVTVSLATAPAAGAQTLDADKDGIFDADEGFYGADPQNPDTDGDSLQDGFEVYELGSSPALADTDDDRLTDYDEWVHGTAPRNPDTDGDEVHYYGRDPKVNDTPAPAPAPAGRLDRDGDGLFDDDETNVYGTNPNVADTDGDGSVDGEEVYLGTDPLTADAAP